MQVKSASAEANSGGASEQACDRPEDGQEEDHVSPRARDASARPSPSTARAVAAEHLREAAYPTEPLPPPGAHRLGRLHPEQRLRLVDDREARELEAPGQVDVLGGHVRREAADPSTARRSSSVQRPGERHQPAPDGVAAPLDSDGRGELDRLEAREQGACEDARVPRHRGQAGARRKRGTTCSKTGGIGLPVGVEDEDEPPAGRGRKHR